MRSLKSKHIQLLLFTFLLIITCKAQTQFGINKGNSLLGINGIGTKIIDNSDCWNINAYIEKKVMDISVHVKLFYVMSTNTTFETYNSDCGDNGCYQVELIKSVSYKPLITLGAIANFQFNFLKDHYFFRFGGGLVSTKMINYNIQTVLEKNIHQGSGLPITYDTLYYSFHCNFTPGACFFLSNGIRFPVGDRLGAEIEFSWQSQFLFPVVNYYSTFKDQDNPNIADKRTLINVNILSFSVGLYYRLSELSKAKSKK